jgi:hypothetical protein
VNEVNVDYDPDTWIRVPLDYVDTRWHDAHAWAEWLADTATAGRPTASAMRAEIRDNALSIALHPAAHVWGRFWFFPIDGDPSGFVDVFVQLRVADGTLAEELLPELEPVALMPVVDALVVEGFASAVRRRTLVMVPRDDADPVAMPQVEWLGIGERWVCYAVTQDITPERSNQREPHIDFLFHSFGAAALDASWEAGGDGHLTP